MCYATHIILLFVLQCFDAVSSRKHIWLVQIPTQQSTFSHGDLWVA